MSGLGDFAAVDLLKGVQAVALGIESVHEMHFGRLICETDGPGS